MSYFTAQLLLDSAASTTVRTKIHDMLVAHSAWSYIKEWTDSTYTVRTYKSTGTLNGTGKDFYVHISHTTASAATSSFYVQTSEDFNSTSNLLIRACVMPASTLTPEATYESAYGDVGYAASSSLWNRYTLAAVNTTDMTYWVIVTSTGLWYRSTADVYGVHVGLFLPFWNHANEYPLWQGHLGNTDPDNGSSLSRRPSMGGVAGMTDTFACYCMHSATTQHSVPMGTVPETGALYEKAYGTRMLVYMTSGTVADTGKYRGLARDLLTFLTNDAVALGDTIQVGSDTYVCLYDGGTYGNFVNTEAA